MRRFLEDEARSKPVPPDLCYVYNLWDPYCPNAISLPAGRAREFQSEMEGLVEDAVAETFVAAIRGIGRIEPEGPPLAAWLMPLKN